MLKLALASTVVFLAVSEPALGQPRFDLTQGDTPTFTNPRNVRATDLSIFIVGPNNSPLPPIGGGSGGPQFPGRPIVGPGGLLITFEADGGPGVAGAGTIPVTFSGFPPNATFEAYFSYPDTPLLSPVQIVQFIPTPPPPVGFQFPGPVVTAVPEPSTLALLCPALGVATGALRRRKRAA